MKQIRAAAILCTFLLAVAAFALQNSAGQSGSSPAGQMGAQSPQANNGQSKTGTSGAQTGTTQPDTQSTTGQTSSGAATTPSQPGSAAGAGPNDAEVQQRIDAQVKILSDQLTLNTDQQTKAKTILLDQHSQAMNIVADNASSRDEKMQKIHALRESTISKVRSMLNDDQKQKFDQMVSAQDDRMRQQQGASPSSGSNPGSTSPSNPGTSSYPNSPGKPPR